MDHWNEVQKVQHPFNDSTQTCWQHFFFTFPSCFQALSRLSEEEEEEEGRRRKKAPCFPSVLLKLRRKRSTMWNNDHHSREEGEKKTTIVSTHTHTTKKPVNNKRDVGWALDMSVAYGNVCIAGAVMFPGSQRSWFLQSDPFGSLSSERLAAVSGRKDFPHQHQPNHYLTHRLPWLFTQQIKNISTQ